MRLRKILAVFVGLLLVSLFSGIAVEAGPVVVRPFDVGLVGALFILGGIISVSGRLHLNWRDPILLSFLLLALYIFLNGLWLASTTEAVVSLVQNVEYVLVLLLIADLSRRPSDRRVFIKTLVIGFAVMAAVTALWHIAQGQVFSYKLLTAPKAAFGFFTLFACVLYFVRQNSVYTLLFVGSFLLLVLSGERKSWVAFAGAFFFILWVRQRVMRRGRGASQSFWLRNLGAAAVLVAALAVITPYVPYISNQVSTLWTAVSAISMEGIAYEAGGIGSNRARLYLLDFSIQSVKEHPVFGIGTGQFREALGLYSFGEGFVLGSHNEYQRIAVENGLVGLFMYVLVWLFMLRRSLTLVKSTAEGRLFSLLVATGLLAYGAIINLFLAGGALNTVYLILPAGLLMGLSAQAERLPRAHKRRFAAAA